MAELADIESGKEVLAPSATGVLCLAITTAQPAARVLPSRSITACVKCSPRKSRFGDSEIAAPYDLRDEVQIADLRAVTFVEGDLMISLLRLMCLLSAGGCAAALAQNSSLPRVQIFAPGIISGPANDGSPTFSPDGETLFFTRYAAHWSVILESHLRNGKWSEPVVAPFSGQWPDSSPTWSPDGKYLIFVSTRPKSPIKVMPGPGEPIPGLVSNLWRIDATANGWTNPVRLPDEVNITGAIYKPSVAANGDIFLTVIGPGASKAIYLSRWEHGSYEHAQLLPFSDGSKLDVDPETAPDESFLIFSSAGRIDGDTHERLFLVKREGDHWSVPKLIRYQNDLTKYGASTDNEPKLSRDGRTLYFSSDRTEPTHFPRTYPDAEEDLRRLNLWDNSNANVWSINLSGLV